MSYVCWAHPGPGRRYRAYERGLKNWVLFSYENAFCFCTAILLANGHRIAWNTQPAFSSSNDFFNHTCLVHGRPISRTLNPKSIAGVTVWLARILKTLLMPTFFWLLLLPVTMWFRDCFSPQTSSFCCGEPWCMREWFPETGAWSRQKAISTWQNDLN